MEIKLLKHCANDLDVVNSARVSLDKCHEVWELDDEPLIRWLMKKHHGTPFEHGYFRFYVEAPIFVFREWHRHRVGHSYNEMSGRYVELEEKFYWPDVWRTQVGKPGAYTYEPIPPNDLRNVHANIAFGKAYERSWISYQELLELGVAKEQARAVLPLGIYTKMYWSCNPRSLMHFLSLRNAKDAQQEIRDMAAQAEKDFCEIMPVTSQAFIDFGRVSP